jgi:hypothetical protein|tara:strand:+ start:2017 stop:2283 length:267 start_codon:yes stop_codon:yes gene_type:complete
MRLQSALITSAQMAKRVLLLLIPLALVLGTASAALLLGAKAGTSKGSYWIYFCRIGVGASAGPDGVKTVGPVEPGYVANMLGKIAGCW